MKKEKKNKNCVSTKTEKKYESSSLSDSDDRFILSPKCTLTSQLTIRQKILFNLKMRWS